jgi:hypothetical protein
MANGMGLARTIHEQLVRNLTALVSGTWASYAVTAVDTDPAAEVRHVKAHYLAWTMRPHPFPTLLGLWRSWTLPIYLVKGRLG